MSDAVDKVSGRVKQAAGDILGDRSLHEQGRKEERKGEVKDEHAKAQQRADEKGAEAARLERETS